MEKKIKVLVVDDAAMVRKILARELARDRGIEVVGAAADAYVGREMISQLQPDVLLLDIMMPQMDGLTFLSHLMRNCPMPVIIFSSLVSEGGEIAMRALKLGAAEVIAKPGPAYSVKEMSAQLIDKIKAVAQLKSCRRFLGEPAGPPLSVPARASNKLVVIGAATGGPEAVAAIVSRLPAWLPPILVVQHMPPYITKAFAEQLDSISALSVREAENQAPLCAGTVLLAPGNRHLSVQKTAAGFQAIVKDGPLINNQRPSIEVLFRSVAMHAGAEAIGVILSGMGRDGAQGLLDMKNAGGFTIAQDEASSAVYGMARDAVALGAVCQVAPLREIAGLIVEHV